MGGNKMTQTPTDKQFFLCSFIPLHFRGLHRPRGVRLLQVFCRCESFLLLYVFFCIVKLEEDANFVRPIEFIHDVSAACHQCNPVTSQHLSKLRLKHETCVRLMYNTQRLNELYLKFLQCLSDHDVCPTCIVLI